MLTATYTLVALSVEQAGLRVSVAALQEQLQAGLRDQQALSAQQMGQACAALQRVVDNWQWRQLDMYLVPAIRRVTGEADRLLSELDELQRAAADAIAGLVQRTGATMIVGPFVPVAAVAYFCAGIDTFCGAVLARIEREERELFPVARSVIPGEAWFSIANQMLVHDARRQERKPARRRPGSELPERRANARGEAAPALRVVPDRRAAPRPLALSA
jgi:hypothetical protein